MLILVPSSLFTCSLLKTIKKRDILLILFLQLGEILEFATEHTPHHVLLKVIDIGVLELHHHLFNFAIGYQAHHGVLVLHQAHWIVVVIIRITRRGRCLN